MHLSLASSFVDMYEKGEYVYAFFREITVELSPNVSEHLLENYLLLLMFGYRLYVHVLLEFAR